MATDYTQRLQAWANLANQLDCELVSFNNQRMEIATFKPRGGGDEAKIPYWLAEKLTKPSTSAVLSGPKSVVSNG